MILGVPFTEEELRSFKEFAPASKGAVLLERIMQKVEMDAQRTLASIGSSRKQIRFAQGKIQAIADVSEIARRLCELTDEQVEILKNADEAGDEEQTEEMEAIDVGF